MRRAMSTQELHDYKAMRAALMLLKKYWQNNMVIKDEELKEAKTLLEDRINFYDFE